MTCKARQYSDQMACSKCGLAWDVNDPEPPQCDQERKRARGIEVLRRLKRVLASLPPVR